MSGEDKTPVRVDEILPSAPPDMPVAAPVEGPVIEMKVVRGGAKMIRLSRDDGD